MEVVRARGKRAILAAGLYFKKLRPTSARDQEIQLASDYGEKKGDQMKKKDFQKLIHTFTKKKKSSAIQSLYLKFKARPLFSRKSQYIDTHTRTQQTHRCVRMYSNKR